MIPSRNAAWHDPTMSEDQVSWRVATERALYGPDGFFRRHRPGAHFRTSVHASPLFAEAVARLARVSSCARCATSTPS